MQHELMLELLGAYLEGTITDTDLAAFKAHVKECPICAEIIRQIDQDTLDVIQHNRAAAPLTDAAERIRQSPPFANNFPAARAAEPDDAYNPDETDA